MNHETEFHGLLNVFAANSKTMLTETMLRVYERTVQPFGYEHACRALEHLMMNTKSWQMPTPQMVLEVLQNRPSKVAEATEAAARIHSSIVKFGYSNPIDAQSFIGPLGWKVVERFGGWSTLCAMMGREIDVSASRAQMRDLALSILDISEKRDLDQPPLLNQSQNPQLNAAVKLLAKGKEFPS